MAPRRPRSLAGLPVRNGHVVELVGPVVGDATVGSALAAVAGGVWQAGRLADRVEERRSRALTVGRDSGRVPAVSGGVLREGRRERAPSGLVSLVSWAWVAGRVAGWLIVGLHRVPLG